MAKFFDAKLNMPLFKYNLNKHKSMILILGLLLFVVFPLPVFMYHFTQSGNYIFSYTFDFQKSRLLLIFVTTALLIVIPFMFYRFLFDKNATDMYHSVPIKRCDLFFTLYMCSFLFVIIPFIINYFIGNILAGIALGSFNWNYTILLLVRLLAIYFAILSIPVIVIINTGTITDAALYTAILFVAPFLAFDSVGSFYSGMVPGFPSVKEYEILGFLSPLSGLFYAQQDNLMRYDGNLFASYWLIFSFIITCLSINIYSKRLSESSGSPFSNQLFFPIIASILTIIVFIYFIAFRHDVYSHYEKFISFKNLTIPFLSAFIFYLVLNIIKDRSTKNFSKSIINFGSITVIVLVICSLIYFTKGFGYSNRFPDTASVDRVEITLNGFDPYAPAEFRKTTTITDKESVEKFISFHQDVIYELAVYETPQALLQSNLVSFTYYNESNKKMSRTFYVSSKLFNEINFIRGDSNVINQFNELLKNEFNTVSIYNDVFTEKVNADSIRIPLVDAYRKDLLSLSSSDRYSNGTTVKYNIITSTFKNSYTDFTGEQVIEYTEPSPSQIVIDDRFTNTITLIEAYLEKVPAKPTESEFKIIDSQSESEFLTTDGTVKRAQDIFVDHNNIPVIDDPTFNVNEYKGKLLNTNFNDKSYKKAFIRVKDGDMEIKSIFPIDIE
ncbi:MAG: hypothetical protein RR565_05400 [Erysipelothrix sp.]